MAALPVDPMVTLMGQMSTLVQQQARMMAEITQLRAVSECQSAKLSTFRRALAVCQRHLRWIRDSMEESASDETGDESSGSGGATS